jgi:ATP-dependent DNA helicase RecG
MLIAVENGYQAALMAPTEILAEQHHRTLLDRLEGLPVQVRLLRGTTKSSMRRTLLAEARDGTAQILVGTHALFEKEVEFARLGLVVIDEQHRFGVLQRALLREKGENPDVLVMTATPIPRTLSLTLYGDLDVSVIDAMPPGRSPVRTVLKPEREKEEVRRFVREQILEGRQAYFVYPLIEESAKVDLKAATVHYEELRDRVFPDLRLGMIHGRMPGDEREATMRSFKEGRIDLLVATTVIEVGIDVPNASVMVIENAERFGLSQLHQLRGRVGRGPERSTCILLAADWAVRSAARGGKRGEAVTDSEEGLAGRRLATMVETTDGFRIAEVDLGLRGPGDYFGTRQSGAPAFRVADLLRDGDLLRRARDDAFEIVARDPHLRLAEHRPLLEHLRTHLRDTMRLMEIG